VIEGDSENQGEEAVLEENSQHIVQYKPIADYLITWAMHLICHVLTVTLVCLAVPSIFIMY
jgi:hypothetical protein